MPCLALGIPAMVHTRGGSAPSARAEASTMKRECPDKSGATSQYNKEWEHGSTSYFLQSRTRVLEQQIHYSKQGQEFKAQAQSLHIEILSPRFCELIVLYMNLTRSKKNRTATELFHDCSLIFSDDSPTLTSKLLTLWPKRVGI